jgi:DNA repair protein RecO (recombination protein O)
MPPPRRISDEAAYMLHRHDWSESSLILEVFTRHHGRIALVAKGARKPSSSFRPVLLPLQPLRLAFSAEGEIRTLKEAEWGGGQVMPTGDALLAGYYLNELILRLLARDDPHPALFGIYAATVQVLGSGHGEAMEPALRAFELLLLRDIGLLPALDVQTLAMAPLSPAELYALQPEAGLVHVDAGAAGSRAALPGADWLALEVALRDASAFHATLQQAARTLPGLKPQLRSLLHYHCGVSTLRTRQLMIDLQGL